MLGKKAQSKNIKAEFLFDLLSSYLTAYHHVHRKKQTIEIRILLPNMSQRKQNISLNPALRPKIFCPSLSLLSV